MRNMLRVTLFALIVSLIQLPVIGKIRPSTNNDDAGVIKSSVNLVTIYANVTSADGNSVGNLKQENFEIYDNGALQEIEYFSEEEKPLSLGIIFDTSASMKDRMEESSAILNYFLDMYHNDDEFFLITFNNRPFLSQDFTKSKDDIMAALKDVEPMGMTALNDAIYTGVEKLKRALYEKKALIVISDGQDNTSCYSIKDLKQMLAESNVQLYTINLCTKDKKSSFSTLEKDANNNLKKFAELTGGRAFFPNSIFEMNALIQQVAKDLRHQYSIGFTAPQNLDGRWHSLKVKVKMGSTSKISVRNRNGYYSRRSS